jgi:transmembrane sensor
MVADPRHLELEDGSQVQLLDSVASLVVDEVTAQRVVVRLLAGRARVEVVPRKERTFQVVCGDVTVEVLGTAFELQRDGERTRVSVLHGRVLVRWPSGSSVLASGEAGWFPKSESEPHAPHAAPPPTVPASTGREARAVRPSSHATARKSAARTPLQPAEAASWQTRVERGDFKEAYALMVKERVSDDVQELLLAADAARLSGHPAEALPFLRRVVEQHPRDPRASLAAFTLAGVLLNQLERPREAEQAYARARSLALSPALAQDALARQVEAARRAGDTERARELASEYLQRYPNGRRVQWVRELGGL